MVRLLLTLASGITAAIASFMLAVAVFYNSNANMDRIIVFALFAILFHLWSRDYYD
jgi:hypothetical protein